MSKQLQTENIDRDRLTDDGVILLMCDSQSATTRVQGIHRSTLHTDSSLDIHNILAHKLTTTGVTRRRFKLRQSVEIQRGNCSSVRPLWTDALPM